MKQTMFWTLAALLICCQSAYAALQINEMYFSPEDPKEDRQFFEIASTTGGATPLTDVWFLELEGDLPIDVADNPGQVLNAFDLSSFSTGSNGLFLWRDSATVIDIDPVTAGVQGPDASTVVNVAPFTQIFGYEGPTGEEFQNNVHTFLLVENYTGGIGYDLDADDDGVIDPPAPWSNVLDGISEAEAGDAGFQYASQVGGSDILLWFGGDIFQRRPSDGKWMIFDSGSGDGEPAGFNGPFFANDGAGPGDSDAGWEDGTEFVVYETSTYLYATPGGANVQIPEPSTALLLTLVGLAGLARRNRR